MTVPTAALMLACYRGQLARVKDGCGYGVGLARTREVERLVPIVDALEALVAVQATGARTAAMR